MMHDTRHSLAAEAHTHAAYEHWVADYQQKRGQNEAAQEFARRAYEHSQEAALLSREAATALLSSDSMNAHALPRRARLRSAQIV
jgi:hypothetical protein